MKIISSTNPCDSAPAAIEISPCPARHKLRVHGPRRRGITPSLVHSSLHTFSNCRKVLRNLTHPLNVRNCRSAPLRRGEACLSWEHPALVGLRTTMATSRQTAVLVALACLWIASLAPAHAALGVVGAPKDVPNFANSVEIDELANFAVDQYKARLVRRHEIGLVMSRCNFCEFFLELFEILEIFRVLLLLICIGRVLLQNSLADISFSKVLSAKEQVVQGTLYYLTIEVMEGGVPKQYDAKVWVKPWEGYKELESFLPSSPSHYNPAVGLGAKSGA